MAARVLGWLEMEKTALKMELFHLVRRRAAPGGRVFSAGPASLDGRLACPSPASNIINRPAAAISAQSPDVRGPDTPATKSQALGRRWAEGSRRGAEPVTHHPQARVGEILQRSVASWPNVTERRSGRHRLAGHGKGGAPGLAHASCSSSEPSVEDGRRPVRAPAAEERCLCRACSSCNAPSDCAYSVRP
jgi:hypothetical protein